jgi:hypothetical protein
MVAVLLVALGGCGQESGARGTGLGSAKSDTAAVVWAVGDGADGRPSGRRVGRMIERGKPDRFLYLGDVYETGIKAEYQSNYEPAFGDLADLTAPTPGNHEWPQREGGYRPYWHSILGKEIPDYYKFGIGGWEILSLNSEAPHDERSQQVRWLRSNLPGNGTCRLAFWHRPRYSFGDHGDQPDVEPLWNALRGRATLIVNGHEHNMERFAPRDGLTELVAGAGGRGIYPIEPQERAQLEFANDTDYGALRLTLRPGRADYRFVAVDGRTLDRGRVRCKRETERDSQPVSAF